MANNFREIAPARTYSRTHGNYRQYKDPLRQDFNKRCGYTDCPDFWFGGKEHFHIDHFIPWKNYPAKPELKTTYSNLVYSCSHVNILKSNDEGMYLDPCDVDYNDHFTRSSDGAILPKPHSVQASYMYSKLKLYLKRYQFIWKLEQLELKLGQLSALIDADGLGKNQALQALIAHHELTKEFFRYKKYLNDQ